MNSATLKKKVLIVEDEAISAMALEFTLERMGYEVSGIVDTGEEAVTHCAKHKPDLVLMDTHLRTAMTGVQAANQIWRLEAIQSVFVSAYNANEIQESFCDAYPLVNLVKPVLDEDLKRVFSQVFND